MKRTFVLFEARKTFYGIDIKKIVSIEKKSDVINLPKTPEYMVGIVNIRGKVVPVIDSYHVFYNYRIPADAVTRYILLDVNGLTIALMVEDTNEIISIDSDSINPVKMLNDSPFFEGIALEGERMITILNIEEIISNLKNLDYIRGEYINNHYETEENLNNI
ncbi:chemotaxis protein CheW [Neobacillus terrae]|uniref:chemotaxis protein CheW n=1 Tax=Neobacillus terrae TaxID=3034837 RepID=UPI00140AE1FA|nr:chemotaxis protein CheW [Neobacillus terrae]NHM33006.1 chemotaxis protein CheW [Neobacillus terrae]